MISQYLVGSKMLGLKNNRDTDILLIFDNENITKENAHQILNTSFDIDYRIWKREEFEQYLKLESLGGKPNNFLWLYQCDKDIIQQNFEYDFHILDVKNKLIPLLKNFMEENFNNENNRDTHFNIKWLYHLAYNIFILQNNSPHLTKDQYKEIQELHDKQITTDKIIKLKDILYSL